jgi:hypothetical protein
MDPLSEQRAFIQLNGLAPAYAVAKVLHSLRLLRPVNRSNQKDSLSLGHFVFQTLQRVLYNTAVLGFANPPAVRADQTALDLFGAQIISLDRTASVEDSFFGRASAGRCQSVLIRAGRQYEIHLYSSVLSFGYKGRSGNGQESFTYPLAFTYVPVPRSASPLSDHWLPPKQILFRRAVSRTARGRSVAFMEDVEPPVQRRLFIAHSFSSAAGLIGFGKY